MNTQWIDANVSSSAKKYAHASPQNSFYTTRENIFYTAFFPTNIEKYGGDYFLID
jgi:hypothetical protein